jgi:hypothetical protein
MIESSEIARQICLTSLPPRVRDYVEAIVRTWTAGDRALVSLVLFGSAAIGGFSGTVSDVDMILVLPDDAAPETKTALRNLVADLELRHGFCKEPPRPPGALEKFVDKVTANGCSFFVCTESDLLSGDVARLLGLPPAQAFFVDRAVLPSIILSGMTVWGRDLLTQVPLAPIRRLDVFKAFFGFWSQALLSLAVFPLLPGATKYAMGTLKHSLHNGFFCYHHRRATLEEEVAFFQKRLGSSRTLAELLVLRKEYRPSLWFVLACLPTLVRLHLTTARDNRFPRDPFAPTLLEKVEHEEI